MKTGCGYAMNTGKKLMQEQRQGNNDNMPMLQRAAGLLLLAFWFTFVLERFFYENHPINKNRLLIPLRMNLLQVTVIRKLFKFGIVGLSGMCIDFLITWICKEKIKLNKYVANTAGFSVAVISNFFFNYIWTFKGTGSNVPSAFGLFILFSVIGLALNNILIYLFTDVGAINFYLSKLLAIAGVFVWNFSSNYFFNFH